MKWVINKLKWLVAREELEALERYRTVCIQTEQWNSSIPHSAATAVHIREVGEGTRPLDPPAFWRELVDRFGMGK